MQAIKEYRTATSHMGPRGAQQESQERLTSGPLFRLRELPQTMAGKPKPTLTTSSPPPELLFCASAAYSLLSLPKHGAAAHKKTLVAWLLELLSLAEHPKRITTDCLPTEPFLAQLTAKNGSQWHLACCMIAIQVSGWLLLAANNKALPSQASLPC